MNKNTGIIVGVIAVVVVAGGVYASMSSNTEMMDKKIDNSAMQKDMMDKNMMQKDDMVKGDEAMQKAADPMVKEDAGSMSKKETMMKGSYEAYASEKLARAQTGDVVLFFHASWCPSCRSLNSDIEANISAIPEGVSILKVDYDKEVELKKKYGVTYQHTLVQVDANGNLIKKWSGSPKLSAALAQIQ